MRAVWMKELGGPEVLLPGDAPEPLVGAGQVLVQVALANITFVETQMRATGFGPFPPDLPTIPGNGVGGTVIDVGEGVDAGLVGTRVVTATGGSGAYAERVAVDATALHVVPEGLPLDEAVALLADGRTALLIRDATSLTADDRVLVLAAAGGVGTLLVQVAKAAGAVVIGVAGGPEKVAVVRDLAADLVVDHHNPEWPGEVRSAVGGVDLVLDGVGGELARAAFHLLDPGGRICSFGAASGAFADISDDEAVARDVSRLGLPRPDPTAMRRATEEALALAASGRVHPVIGQRFALDHAADAHAAMEARTTIGKTLLVVDDERPR